MIAKLVIGATFAGLLTYLTAARALTPDDILLFNVASCRTAAKEMAAEARKSKRVKKPVGHLILSWSAKEKPSVEMMREAANRLLDQLGLSDHKAVVVAHPTTDRHFHLHIAFCRVGPNGTVAKSVDSWAFATVERAAAGVAADLGFAIIPGRFNTLSSDRFGPALAIRNPDIRPPLSDGFRAYAAQTGATPIRDQLYADAGFRQEIIAARMAGDWRGLVETFARRGFDLCINAKNDGRPKKLGAGLVIVDRSEPKRRQALSSLNLTADEKWSGPGLVRGLGRVGSKTFPAMGEPPEGLISVVAPIERERDQQSTDDRPIPKTSPPRPPAEPRKVLNFASTFADFTAQRETAQRQNSDVAKARSAARELAKREFDRRFDAMIATAKVRRRLVRSVFGGRSLLARAINWIADARVEREIAALGIERRQAVAAIDADFARQRAVIPRWVDFKAAASAEFRQNRRNSVVDKPPSVDFGTYRGAVQARFGTSVDVESVESVIAAIGAAGRVEAVAADHRSVPKPSEIGAAFVPVEARLLNSAPPQPTKFAVADQSRTKTSAPQSEKKKELSPPSQKHSSTQTNANEPPTAKKGSPPTSTGMARDLAEIGKNYASQTTANDAINQLNDNEASEFAAQTRWAAFKASLQSDDRSRQRLKRIATGIYFRWLRQYRERIDSNFRDNPNSPPHRAAYGVTNFTDKPYMRRWKEEFAKAAFAQRSGEKAHVDAFFARNEHPKKTKTDPHAGVQKAQVELIAAVQNLPKSAEGDVRLQHQQAASRPQPALSVAPNEQRPNPVPAEATKSAPKTSLSPPPLQAPNAPPVSTNKQASAAVKPPGIAPNWSSPETLTGDERILAAAYVAFFASREQVVELFRSIALAIGPNGVRDIVAWIERVPTSVQMTFLASVGRNSQGGPDAKVVAPKARAVCVAKGLLPAIIGLDIRGEPDVSSTRQ
jgi:hypothetical protein